MSILTFKPAPGLPAMTEQSSRGLAPFIKSQGCRRGHPQSPQHCAYHMDSGHNATLAAFIVFSINNHQPEVWLFSFTLPYQITRLLLFSKQNKTKTVLNYCIPTFLTRRKRFPPAWTPLGVLVSALTFICLLCTGNTSLPGRGDASTLPPPTSQSLAFCSQRT